MKRSIYLFLAILGIILPYTGFVPFLLKNGFNLPLLFQEMFNSNIGTFFSWDVIISGIVLLVFIIFDEKRPTTTFTFWLVILGLFSIGVSFALPFYLFLRETHKN